MEEKSVFAGSVLLNWRPICNNLVLQICNVDASSNATRRAGNSSAACMRVTGEPVVVLAMRDLQSPC